MAPSAQRRTRRWLTHPLLLLPAKAAVVIGTMILTVRLFAHHRWPAAAQVLLIDPVTILVLLAVFIACTRYVEARAVTELSPRGALRQIVAGFGLGALAFALVIGVLAALGLYHVTGHNGLALLWVPLAGSLVGAVFEELLFRGILFRITEDWLGSYWALAVSSLFFGCAHLLNPHATWLAAIAIMIEAGVFLGAAYMLTRRLWLPIGIHAGWNFNQGGLFGVPVSGLPSRGLLQATLSGGPVWLSGGEFGAESSVVAIVVCGGIGIALLLRARRLNHVVAPYWRRK
jgi:uncharacterized protein